MPQDERDILDVLKAELNFVQKGGYGRSPREPRRAQLVFEDSPTCMNYDNDKDHRSPCSECILMQFVPAAKRNEKVPCRHIPITAEGDALIHLYRGATEYDIHDAVEAWLKATIARIEQERAAKLQAA